MRCMNLRFDVNCSILFTGLPLLDRPAAARAAGFEAVEFWWPWDVAVPSAREADRFVTALGDAGVRLAALNFFAGDLAAGERGLLSDPMRISEFRDSVDVGVDIAARTGCTVLNALYGNRPGRDELAILNLMIAARAAAPAGATLVIEALNSYDCPRYPVTSSETAIEVIDAVRADGAPNVGFLADVYHLGRMGEDLTSVLASPYVTHVQVADVPGRGAPGTGSLDFPALFSALAAAGYPGWIGCEYLGVTSFDWLADLHHKDMGNAIATERDYRTPPTTTPAA
jgi:hydroxypyruvate isomerase